MSTAVRLRLRNDQQRTPLLTPDGALMLKRLREHPDAPRFNHATGDRLELDDLPGLARFREGLQTLRQGRSAGPPPAAIVQRVALLSQRVPFFRAHLVHIKDLESQWETIPTTSRLNVAIAPWEFVPDDEPLDRMVIYRTAGTTGHPISIPHHPAAIRFYEPLIEFALARHGAKPEFAANTVASFLVCAQIWTYTYAAVLSTWNGAGFAKLNIRQNDWPHEGSQERYFIEFAPQFLSGDPISFSEMLHMDLPASPTALITTSVAMSPTLKKRLSQRYHAPVVDWYSLVETGPIGYACPHGFGYHVLPHDLHVESLRNDGTACAPGERGEITVTGGRNHFFPLLRYRTGDFGIIDYGPCTCGDPMPRLLELEGRVPVLFRSSDGTPVSTVDLSRILREFPLLLHEFTQHSNRECELVLRPMPDAQLEMDKIELALRGVLGTLPLDIRIDAKLGERTEGKALPYRSELLLED